MAIGGSTSPDVGFSTTAKHIVSGGLAGGIEVAISYPIEYVKTNLQLDEKGAKKQYNGIIDCFKKTVKTYGFLGLYRGMAVLIYGAVPKTAVCFGAYEQFKSVLSDEHNKLTPRNTLLCGLGSGVVEATLVTTPMETIKVKLINDRRSAKPQYRGFLHGAYTIVRNEGFSGIYKGLTPTALRQCTNHGIRFSIMEAFKDMYQRDDPGRKVPKWLTCVMGCIAGGSAVCCNTPIDVLKTRMQGLDAAKYKNTLDCIYQMCKYEGVLSLYKGMLPRLIRISLNAGIIFTLYDTFMELFESAWIF